jgi:flagellar biosynthetic protein FlhB
MTTSSSDSELDRNEAATPHKLDEARKRGQVSKSADVVSWLVFGAAMAYLSAQGWKTLQDLFGLGGSLLVMAGRTDNGPQSLLFMALHAMRSGLMALLPLLLLLMLAALLGNLGQTGAVWSWHPVKPDWERINPATGFKRVFSMRTLFDAARACIKLLLLSLVAWFALKALLPTFGQLAGVTPWHYVRLVLASITSLGFKFALALGIIAAIDFAWTQREFGKKMRMSRREVKDEVKGREGDPRIRSRLRELRREMLKRTMALKRTADADVLITNPTHIAVALRYEHGRMEAPVVLAKGAGAMAAAMRKLAARHHVPVVTNRKLARALFKQAEPDQTVPETLYADVARLMVWVMSMREARTAGASA